MNPDDFRSYCLSTLGLDETTVSDSLSKLRVFEKWLTENSLEINDDSVEAFLLWVRGKYPAGTTNNFINFIKRVGKYYKDRGLTPLTRVESYKQLPYRVGIVEVLTIEEIQKILDACTDPVIHTFLMFLVLTGCRIGEACSVKVEDLLVDQKKIVFRETKTDQDREAFLSDKMLGLLETQIKGKTSSDYIFGQANNLSATRYFRGKIAEVCKNLGINKNIHPHIFRHSYATALLAKNVGIQVVSRLLGHVKIETTFKYYSHFNDYELRKAAYKHPLIESSIRPEERLKNLAEEIRHITS